MCYTQSRFAASGMLGVCASRSVEHYSGVPRD